MKLAVNGGLQGLYRRPGCNLSQNLPGKQETQESPRSPGPFTLGEAAYYRSAIITLSWPQSSEAANTAVFIILILSYLNQHLQSPPYGNLISQKSGGIPWHGITIHRLPIDNGIIRP
jgi:hypothetical protein